MQEKKEFRIERIFDAPIEMVWRAWTTPEMLVQWWGPNHFSSPECKIDLRPGGKYLYTMRTPEGVDTYSGGTFNEIVPMEKIVATDHFADKDGNVIKPSAYGMGEDFPVESMVTTLFEKQGDKTKLTIVYADVSGIEPETMKDMNQGWNESLDKMSALF